MSDALPIWQCEFNVPTGHTVGAPFSVKCHGDIPVSWNQNQKLNVNFSQPEDEYSLVVLKAEKLEPQSADLLLVSYKAGPHQPEYIRIRQDNGGFEVAKPKWEIQSVLKQGQKAEAYPPFGPWLFWPSPWLLLPVVIVFVVLVAVVIRWWRRRSQRRAMLSSLEKHKTALTPLHQFYRDARQLRRRINTLKPDEDLAPVVAEVEKLYRLFLLRQFLVPTFDWSDREVLLDIRRRHKRVYKSVGDDIRKALKELSQIHDKGSALESKDVDQLLRLVVSNVERLELHL